MIYPCCPDSRLLSQQAHHHWENPLNLPALLRKIMEAYGPRQRISFLRVPAFLPFLLLALGVQIGYAKLFDPFTNNQAVSDTFMLFIAFFARYTNRHFFFSPQHARPLFVALPKKMHFCHTSAAHGARKRGNEGELGLLAREEKSGILRRKAIGIGRANITSHKLIHRAQLLIVFKTPLG